MPLEIQHVMCRELFKGIRNSVSTAVSFFQKMPQSTPESSAETVQANTVSHVEKAFADTEPLVDLSESTELSPNFRSSAQSVMSEHKGASENEDAFGIIHSNNSVKMIVCDGVTNNWASGIVARSFVELARQKDFWSIEDIEEEDIKLLQDAWVKEFHGSPWYKDAQERGWLTQAQNYLETKAGATTFNQVEITYDQGKQQYVARAWILGNGLLLIINKNKPLRFFCNGEESLSSDGTKGFLVGKDKFKIGYGGDGKDWESKDNTIPLESGDICYLMSDGIANAFLQMSRDPIECEKLFTEIDADQLRKLQHEGIKNGWIEDDDATFVRVAVGER